MYSSVVYLYRWIQLIEMIVDCQLE